MLRVLHYSQFLFKMCKMSAQIAECFRALVFKISPGPPYTPRAFGTRMLFSTPPPPLPPPIVIPDKPFALMHIRPFPLSSGQPL